MEKDIDILETVVNCRKVDGIYSTNEVIFKAIENLINRNKELEEYYKEQNEVNAKFIPKSKVKEKINKKQKQLDELKKNLKGKQTNFVNKNMIIGEIQVLQELLEE